MGRRSIKSTKSGKFMNPTDQARKEARKKELKKNKKQRLLVRTAVLKNKDPGLIIEELDKLDEMEYNVHEPPQLAEKVMKDKRRKLKETLDRVMKLYQKDEPTYWSELKQIENDYERRRFHRIQFYEAVKQAESVSNVEDIPLPPSLDIDTSTAPPPPPPEIPKGILKHSVVTIEAPPTQFLGPGGKRPPGVPPGVAPTLSSESEDESDDEDGEVEAKETRRTTTKASVARATEANSTVKKSVRFDTMDEMDKFMMEVEEEFKAMKEDELNPPGVESEKPKVTQTLAPPPPPPSSQEISSKSIEQQQSSSSSQQLPIRPFFAPTSGARPYFPFPPPPLGHIGMPPPPPPRVRFNSRFRQPPRLPQTPTSQAKLGEVKITSEAMIQAKPQIRSLSADVTRFIPVAVRTRREDTPSTKEWKPTPPTLQFYQKTKPTSKDDAYEDFMKEMEGLL